MGTVWHAHCRVDVTGALKPAENRARIKVTNFWVNRLIGDLQPGAKTKYTFTSWKIYKRDSPLPAQGMIGPVVVLADSKTPANPGHEMRQAK
jgi:hypothetical protein